MVGASGERMLHLTARYADLWNGACPRPDHVSPLRDRVDAACRAERRDPATLDRTIAVLVDFTDGRGIPSNFNPARLPPLSGTPVQLAAALGAFASEGISHVQLTPLPMKVESVEQLAPVLDILDGAASQRGI
jgi:alkanesulfonate monooxygenase SsuD/methylene tetrahydromethanopterin reductase-like flavin-dependent oxidoreductase (luciferase family)